MYLPQPAVGDTTISYLARAPAVDTALLPRLVIFAFSVRTARATRDNPVLLEGDRQARWGRAEPDIRGAGRAVDGKRVARQVEVEAPRLTRIPNFFGGDLLQTVSATLPRRAPQWSSTHLRRRPRGRVRATRAYLCTLRRNMEKTRICDAK